MPPALCAPRRLAVLTILAALAAAAPSAGAIAAVQAEAQTSASHDMQGDQRRWINDPHTRALYDTTVAAFAHGPSQVNRVKYEQECRAIFRDFGVSMGMNPEAMEEHLKLIPSQVIQIATEDPSVLSSFDKFIAAVFGPQ